MAAAEESVESIFQGIVALFVEHGVQPRRLQVWKQKFLQRGGVLRQHINSTVTHIFAAERKFLEERVGRGRVSKLHRVALKYEWLEDCLKEGHSVAPEPYLLNDESNTQPSNSDESHPGLTISSDDLGSPRPGSFESKHRSEAQLREEVSEPGEDSCKHRKIDWMSVIHKGAKLGVVGREGTTTNSRYDGSSQTTPSESVTTSHSSLNPTTEGEQCQLIDELAMRYDPPDLNKNITDLFGELEIIYKYALGEDWRSFSYHKANSVLEKVPFKITSVDQAKGLPTIGKSLLENIGEILSTGTLTKLEHLKEDEKVFAMSQFAKVWGIGPSTALKLYEKGHRTLDDLEGEESLSSAQRCGLKFRSDMEIKIPRHEVREMVTLVQKWAESIEQDVIVVCGGSYRRGKAWVGDMDIVVTHPDGKSHRGFLRKLVQKLKNLDFLAEDLTVGMAHVAQESRERVDTYFGLCKYPGRELRHRIDFKVFPFEQYPFGLIAWTGNDVLNRRIKLLAISKGYTLDDHGCFPAKKDAAGERLGSRSVPCKTEREVFDFLGFPWLEPHERNL